ncbi:hypothetical protein [Planctomicrobium piriforme]|uniref:hypothetical protein n=1 Tax=Planctomicrobium piriforme TaxID=1576369 RepID=UPI001113E5A4|nr:hypothetical protein [Planctomicrobium piriforme]
MDAVKSTRDLSQKSRLVRPRVLIVILVVGAVAYFVSSLVRQRLLTAVLSAEVENLGGSFNRMPILPDIFNEPWIESQLRRWTKGRVTIKPRVSNTIVTLSTPFFDDAWVNRNQTSLSLIPRLCLCLNGCSITDEGLKRLGPLANLEELSVGKCQVTGKGLRILCGARSITRLEFLSQKSSSGELSFQPPPRTAFDQQNAALLADKLQCVANQTQLESVRLSAEELSLAAIEQLNTAPELKTLEIDDVIDGDIALLSHLNSLHLWLRGLYLTNASVPSFKTLIDVRSVELDVAIRVSDKDLQEIKTAGINIYRTPFYMCSQMATLGAPEPKDVESTSDESVESAME